MEKKNNKQDSGLYVVYSAQFSRISSYKKESVNNSCPSLLSRVSGHDADVCHVGGGECSIKPDSEDAGCDPTGDVMSHKAKKRKKKWNSFGDMEDSILGTRHNDSQFIFKDNTCETQPVGADSPHGNSLNENISESLSKRGEQKPYFYVPQVNKLNNNAKNDMKPGSVEANVLESNSNTFKEQPRRISVSSIHDKLLDAPDKIIDEPDFEVTQTLVHNDEDKLARKFYISESCTWPVVKGLVFPLVGLLLYFWDIGSDIWLAVKYKKNGDMTRFDITVGCIVIPHLIMAVVDVSWVYMDRRKQKSNSGECVESWSKRFVLGFLTLGRIVRSVTYMHHVFEAKKLPKDDTSTRQTSPLTKNPHNGAHVSEICSYSSDVSAKKRRKWHKARAREQKRDCFMLDFINAFAGSAPQLFVQLYLYYRYDLPLTIVRVLNLLSSWASIAWTYAAYYRSNREALNGREDVNFVGFVFFLGAFLAALAARAISIVLFLVYWSVPAGVIFAGVHFLFMLLWIICKEKPILEGTTTGCWRYLYYVFFAYVCLLGFTNLSNSKAKVRMTVFYGLMYVENIVLASLTYWKMSEIGDVEYASHFLALVIGFIIHVVLLINYYILLHPTTGKCFNCPMEEHVANGSSAEPFVQVQPEESERETVISTGFQESR